MENSDFRKYSHQLADWMADYFENIEKYPVRSQVQPGDIKNQIPNAAPLKSEDLPEIMKDFEKVIMPGITHWQHPGFNAYFPAGSSYPSVLAEMLTSTLAAQCMIWQTSPSAAELEEVMMNWLRDMTGLPKYFHGVIQDTASTATLVAILTAREKYSDFNINEEGFFNHKFVAYCSSETHSSVEKGVKIAGIGRKNLRKIKTDLNFSMIPAEFEKQIQQDIASGLKPFFVTAAIGTTGSCAVDPIEEIATICEKYNIWLHIDAAYAGTAMLLPELRYMIKGVEKADSYVFNPHKWMFTNFDCTAYFVKDKETLIRTFDILPEYLKTSQQDVNNYRDWGIQLGRRFRALKLWFIIRSFGVEGLQNKIREHIRFAQLFEKKIIESGHYEILAPVNLNLVCFRVKPKDLNPQQLDQFNERLLENINKSGKLFATHTKLNGVYTIRMVFGQQLMEERHVNQAFEIFEEQYQMLLDDAGFKPAN